MVCRMSTLSHPILIALLDGHVMSMLNIQRDYKEEYNALADEEREELVREYKENLDSNKKLRRPLPRGRIQDIANIKRNMIYLVHF